MYRKFYIYLTFSLSQNHLLQLLFFLFSFKDSFSQFDAFYVFHKCIINFNVLPIRNIDFFVSCQIQVCSHMLLDGILSTDPVFRKQFNVHINYDFIFLYTFICLIEFSLVTMTCILEHNFLLYTFVTIIHLYTTFFVIILSKRTY